MLRFLRKKQNTVRIRLVTGERPGLNASMLLVYVSALAPRCALVAILAPVMRPNNSVHCRASRTQRRVALASSTRSRALHQSARSVLLLISLFTLSLPLSYKRLSYSDLR